MRVLKRIIYRVFLPQNAVEKIQKKKNFIFPSDKIGSLFENKGGQHCHGTGIPTFFQNLGSVEEEKIQGL